jgi:hypothetical protein
MKVASKTFIAFALPISLASFAILARPYVVSFYQIFYPPKKVLFHFYPEIPSTEEQIFESVIAGLFLLGIILPMLIIFREFQRLRDDMESRSLSIGNRS